MSVIARYLFRSRPTIEAGLYDRCQNVTDHWASEICRGRPAWTVDRPPFPPTNHRLTILRAAGQKLETLVALAEVDDRVTVYVELAATGPTTRRGTLPATPGCVRNLLDMADAGWELGGEPYTTTPPTYTARTVLKLQGRLLSPARQVPLVVVSQDGFRPELASRLAVDLGGLAVVASVDEAASDKLTKALTQAWGCYGGAVRVYWPGEAGKLWLRSTPADQIALDARDEVMRWSATGVSPPESIAPPKHPPPVTAVGRPPPASNPAASGWVKARRAKSTAGQTATPVAAGPATPAKAVALAKRRFAGRLVFGADVARGTAGLAASAGPPAKILEWLGLLAELTDVRRSKELTVSPADWLKQHGAKGSGESRTVRRSEKLRGHRTWDWGDRTKRYFDAHIKPSRGYRGECARVYYEWCEKRKVYVVGWVGPHPPE